MSQTDALNERILASTIGLFDLAGVYLGERLGLYRALHDGGPASSEELARRTGTDERYMREWLEHQAVTGLLAVDDDTAGATSGATRCRRATPSRWSTLTTPHTSPRWPVRRSGCSARCGS